MPFIFLIGILLVAFEDIIKINKTAIVLGMSIVLWGMFLFGADIILANNEVITVLSNKFPAFHDLSSSEQIMKFMSFNLTEALGDVSSTLFFILGSMALVEILDAHGVFSLMSQWFCFRKKRSLLWAISILTFFLSAILGNLATVIIVLAMNAKLLHERSDRLLFAGMVIVAANAGGCWSPIGDVTTLLLWTGGNTSLSHQVPYVILPALCMLFVPLIGITFSLKKEATLPTSRNIETNRLGEHISKKFKISLLVTALVSFILVPILQTWIDLPPFMGIFAGLVFVWVITDLRYATRKSAIFQKLRVSHAFTKIDVSTVLYFLGILMSVDALTTAGQLDLLAEFFNNLLPPELISIVLGLCSSFLDNVALVAATMGMYPIADAGPFMADGTFWTLLTYCAVTGGSILIIGSAAGVTAMGIEKISFGYYLKKFTPLVLLAYFIGAGLFLILFV